MVFTEQVLLFYKKRVFPIIDKNFKYEDNLKIILDNLVYPNSIELNEKNKNFLNKYMTKNKKIQILSYECFTGHPFSGGINQIEIINRLRKFFPSSSILLIFREQRNHIKSMYKKYIKDGGRKY